MKKFVALLLVMLLALSTLTACGGTKQPTEPNPGSSNEPEAETPANEPANKKYKIGFSMDYTSNPWRANMRNKVVEAAEAHADEIELICTDADADTNKQISDVEDLVQQGIDLLIISPYQTEPLTPIVAEVYESGIPVLVLDRAVSGDAYTSFLGASNDLIGQLAGDAIVDMLGETGGNVVEITTEPGLSVTLGRGGEMHKIVDKYENINFIASLCGVKAGADQITAMGIMEDILQSNAPEDIDIVYTHNDTMCLGAVSALEDAGVDLTNSNVKVIGVDGQKEVLELIKEGKVYGTFQYPPPGKEAIEAALTILKGGEVEKFIELDCPLITAENVDQFYDPNSAF